jgi:hypothetical protein
MRREDVKMTIFSREKDIHVILIHIRDSGKKDFPSRNRL